MAADASAGPGEARLSDPSTDAPPHASARPPVRISPRVLAIGSLGVMTVLLMVAAFLASRALAPVSLATQQLVPVGTAAQVPGGSVRVVEVEHVETEGRAASNDSHAIEVRFQVQPDKGVRPDQLVGEMRLQGDGIVGLLAPLEDPDKIDLPSGDRRGEFWLTYVVPDESTLLGVALPGGELLSVAHADHPGDA